MDYTEISKIQGEILDSYKTEGFTLNNNEWWRYHWDERDKIMIKLSILYNVDLKFDIDTLKYLGWKIWYGYV